MSFRRRTTLDLAYVWSNEDEVLSSFRTMNFIGRDAELQGSPRGT